MASSAKACFEISIEIEKMMPLCDREIVKNLVLPGDIFAKNHGANPPPDFEGTVHSDKIQLCLFIRDDGNHSIVIN